jgi:hypothetical protein
VNEGSQMSRWREMGLRSEVRERMEFEEKKGREQWKRKRERESEERGDG